jgi:molecular chaperone GrpE
VSANQRHTREERADDAAPSSENPDDSGAPEGPAETAQASPPDSAGGDYDALYDKHLRLSAEFDNYKKRMARERDAYLQFANERLLKEWLPVVDNIERALHHAKEHNAPETVVEGWALILKQCRDVLDRAGVTVIDSVGHPFNPEVHQAIAQRESADQDDQTVMDEAQRGYLLKGRILRPSLVTVARQPTMDTGPSDEDMKEEEDHG